MSQYEIYGIPVTQDVYEESMSRFGSQYDQKLTASSPKKLQPSAYELKDLELKFYTAWCLLHADEPLEIQMTGLVPDRKFVVDFYHVASRVAIEIQGGTSQRPVKINGKWMIPVSGHNSMAGINRDCEKMLLAATHGIITLCVTEFMLRDANITFTIDQIWRVVKGRTKA